MKGGQRLLPLERLQKVLAHAGVASRRRAEEVILAGRVQVDGETVDTLGVRVDPEMQTITVDGKPIEREAKVTYLLHKPLGVMSTVRDPEGRPTVRQLLQEVNERVYPVGRLDIDTSGVLLLTNDGELSFRLTHPSFEVKKVYRATVRGYVDAATVQHLASGVSLDDGDTSPAMAKIIRRNADHTLLELAIHEGRNRQVRRMCDAVGHPVLKLARTRFAFLSVDTLTPGAYRLLDNKEIHSLRRLVGLD